MNLSSSESMRNSAFVFCLVLLSVASVEAQDFQSWNEIDFSASWRGVGLTLPLLARVDSRLPNPQLAATGITADVPLLWRLSYFR